MLIFPKWNIHIAIKIASFLFSQTSPTIIDHRIPLIPKKLSIYSYYYDYLQLVPLQHHK